MFISKLRFYSIGIVAEDKAKDTHIVPVIPIEVIPDLSGAVGEMLTTREVSGVDSSAKEYNITIKSKNTIRCNWLPIGNSNRVTSPDVVRGEKVVILQFADTDKFFWSTLGMTDDLRLLETTVYAWAARPDHTEELDVDLNCYTLEVSSDAKFIRLKTTQALGEPFAYTLEFDLNVGKVTLTDNTGNTIFMDSAERIIKAANSDETAIEINKRDILFNAPDNVTGAVGGELKANVGKLVEVDCEGDVKVRGTNMEFGRADAVQPSVLGDNMAEAWSMVEQLINSIQVVGNLGVLTSTVSAVKVFTVPDLLKGGKAYSTVNKNQ